MARPLPGGDEAAFELLVWRHGPMVLSVCRRVLGDEHGAEDAFQTAFLALGAEVRRDRPGRSRRRVVVPGGVPDLPSHKVAQGAAGGARTDRGPGACAEQTLADPSVRLSWEEAAAAPGRRGGAAAGRIPRRLYPLSSGRQDQRGGGPRAGLPRRHDPVAAVPGAGASAFPAAEAGPGAGIHPIHLFHSTAPGARGRAAGPGLHGGSVGGAGSRNMRAAPPPPTSRAGGSGAWLRRAVLALLLLTTGAVALAFGVRWIGPLNAAPAPAAPAGAGGCHGAAAGAR